MGGRKMAPLCRQAFRMKTTWVMMRCSSSGDMYPATQLPLPTRGSLELPKSPGHVVPGIA